MVLSAQKFIRGKKDLERKWKEVGEAGRAFRLPMSLTLREGRKESCT